MPSSRARCPHFEGGRGIWIHGWLLNGARQLGRGVDDQHSVSELSLTAALATCKVKHRLGRCLSYLLSEMRVHCHES
eukprot:5439506-Amphidinium_carterae.1